MNDMLQFGYDGVGIAGVLSKTGVPKGSFYHYFDSKEAFACAIVRNYGQRYCSLRRATFKRTDLAPLDRLHLHFRDLANEVANQEGLGGCLLGNLSQLAASRSELIRHAVETVFEEWQTDIIDVLEAAQDAGELSETLDHDQIQALAASIIEGYEGALIRSKSQASSTPLERFCAQALKRLLS